MRLFVFSILTLFFQFQVFAEKTEFQQNSEEVIEQTETVNPDGTRTKTIRSGKPRTNKQPTVGNIQDDQIHQIERRQKSLSFTGLGFGPFGSSNVGNSKILYGLSVGHHWEVMTTGEIVLEATGAFNGDGFLLNPALGFNYMPMVTEFSPIIGGEFGYGAAYGKDTSDGAPVDSKTSRGGFSLQANLGLRMFRLASTQMEVMGTYTVILSSPSFSIYGVQLRVLF